MKAVVVSLDAELALGFHDLERPPQHRVDAGRPAWRWLLDQLEAHSIPCTWALVGHLFLEQCDGRHADHPSPEGWFDADPGGDRSTAPDWFGSDLIAAIQASPVAHEVGTHTFSHVEFGRADVTESVARAELERCVDLAARADISLDSIVFPRNSVGHLDVVEEAGLLAYRGASPSRWYDGTPLRSVGKGLSHAVGRSTPPIVEPTLDQNGLVKIPQSMFLFSMSGTLGRLLGTVRADPIVRMVERGLAALARRDRGILHLWLHPNNLVGEPAFERMEGVFAAIDRYRADHDVPVRTMRGVAEAARVVA